LKDIRNEIKVVLVIIPKKYKKINPMKEKINAIEYTAIINYRRSTDLYVLH
tara:strand:+ start:258 stop:410 length:153 start_codon:yes stop_codon:yes gene_type:complete